MFRKFFDKNGDNFGKMNEGHVFLSVERRNRKRNQKFWLKNWKLVRK